MRLIVLLTVVISTSVAQTGSDYTAQMANGRMWRLYTTDKKISYVNAIRDSLVWKALTSQPPTDQANWAFGFTVGDYISELDALYKDAANIRIPLPAAMDFCTTKLTGRRKKDDLENILMALRQLAAKMNQSTLRKE